MNAIPSDLHAAPATAGQYLRRCREAAGLTVDELAAGCALPQWRNDFTARLEAMESDKDAAGPSTLALLHSAMDFDPEVYRQLVEGSCPPGIATEPRLVLRARDPHAVAVTAILSYLRAADWHHARKALEDRIRELERAPDVLRPTLDQKGSEEAAAAALDMTEWRMTFVPGEHAHV
ncbi:hypothetical protein O4H52_08025 [Sphingomonadaceae bacterium G21617-S1]|nr:hypothetical protein [Sphingomonadaceae bacterium G21617-S1]